MLKLFKYFTNGFVRLANFTRHVILLLILFAIVLLFASGNDIQLQNQTALLLAPQGNVVNQFSGTPTDKLLGQIQGNSQAETQMRDLLRAIKQATYDKRISVLVLNPDNIWSIGLADLQELATAIEQFRQKSHKPVIAIAENLSQHQYYFASLADEIILDPQGFMFFQGYGNYRNYFKEGLDKLGVDVHLFRVGEYKSAAEPYIRNDMSVEAKEAALHYMNGLWDTYLEGIAQRRKLSVTAVREIIEDQAQLIDSTQGNIASMYKNAGLIDQIKNSHFKNKYLAGLSQVDKDKGFRHIVMQDYLSVLQTESKPQSKHKVAIIVAEGTILDGIQNAGDIGGVSTSALLRKARLDKSIKAVVLRIDSGGGSAFASEQIRSEVDAIKVAGKPIVVSMGNVAASGGYWIAMTADKIFASNATITGSIGIFGMFVTYPKTLEKIGVYTDGVGTSSWAGAFRPDKELNEGLSQLIQANIEHGYYQFISSVAMARNLDLDMVDSIARGRVWTAKQAKELGLIDAIGSLDDAVAYAATQANIGNDYAVTWVEQELTSMQELILTSLVKTSAFFAIKLPSQEHNLYQQILQPMEQSLKLILHANKGQITQIAHCFCQVKQ